MVCVEVEGISHEPPFHINTRTSPIPTRVYMPVIATPRQTSDMTLSDSKWVICLLRTGASRREFVPAQQHHAGTRKSFRVKSTKVHISGVEAASVPLREQLNLDLRPPCERVPPQNSKGTNRLWRGWKGAGRRYFGGCSSPLSQPITLSVLIGSGRSHSKHWNMRGPFPSEGAATNIRYAPHLGHLNRST